MQRILPRPKAARRGPQSFSRSRSLPRPHPCPLSAERYSTQHRLNDRGGGRPAAGPQPHQAHRPEPEGNNLAGAGPQLRTHNLPTLADARTTLTVTRRSQRFSHTRFLRAGTWDFEPRCRPKWILVPLDPAEPLGSLLPRCPLWAIEGPGGGGGAQWK
ncbi:unnamed protein product [Rangifer tarandus platyrhynchus]|uniref:Uncharacterized protein n=2 Tax=Rangifer tarandus platyrhynchus TaxID=3082113 RepID=A0ABN8Y5Z0_RANTA|nr:unnamed protein product [Rangifer tarandus platyrhynchus]CAI9695045.1 unnamed protein product [Rangifer tarandus platyrhynchus]